MIYENFKNYINYLYYSGNLNIETLEKSLGYEGLHLTEYIKTYVDYLLNKKQDYKSLVLILPTLLKCFTEYENKKIYGPYIHALYSDLQYRTRGIDKNQDEEKILKKLRQCRKIIKEFISNLETDKQEIEKKEEDKKFNYIWHVLTEIRDPKYYQLLTQRQNSYLNITDAAYNSLFYRLTIEYLDNYDEYYLRVLPVILENPGFTVEQEEIEKIYKELEKHYQFKADNKAHIDRLKKLLDHYLAYENETWKVVNSYSHMESKIPNTVFTYPVLLDRIDTMDRVDLTKLSTFSLADKPKSKEDLDMFSSIAYSIVEKNENHELYIHIPDIPEFIKIDSLENERASYMMEEVKHRHQILPLFDRQFLCNCTNFLPYMNRLAITFRVCLDAKFRVTKIEIFKSTINNDRILKIPTTSKDKEYQSLAHIAHIVSRKEDFDKNREKHIKNALCEFLHKELAKLHDGHLPFVYKNLIRHENMEDILKYSLLTEFTHKSWNDHTARQYLSVYNNHTLDITMYTTSPLVSAPNSIVLARVADPHSSYIALENLRMIKDIVIDKKSTNREWRERALLNALIANAANQETFIKDANIKRLLLTRNNCDKIDL